MGGPSGHEARGTGKPQHHQKVEEAQHTQLAKGHGPQLPMLLTDDVVGGDLLLGLLSATAPRLLETAQWWSESKRQ